MIDLHFGDCLEVMKDIETGSVDMICCDLPYGTSFAAWDSIIPMDKLWEQYKRIIKPTGIIALFGSQPFSSALIASNYDWFKYELIWEKGRASGHVHAKNKPMKAHENILIFSNGTTVHANQSKNRATYNPQMTDGDPYSKKQVTSNVGQLNHADSKANIDFIGSVSNNKGTRYPRSVLKFKNHNVGNLHPTAKPLALIEWLIKTYSNENETVLDCCIGSGTTAVAAINTGRNCIGIEKDLQYFDIATKRINDAKAHITG